MLILSPHRIAWLAMIALVAAVGFVPAPSATAGPSGFPFNVQFDDDEFEHEIPDSAFGVLFNVRFDDEDRPDWIPQQVQQTPPPNNTPPTPPIDTTPPTGGGSGGGSSPVAAPTPSAALAGLALMGALAGRRRPHDAE
ncbi:MAG: hypothetical protein AAFX76_00285 [Planctomycetota bacterium]